MRRHAILAALAVLLAAPLARAQGGGAVLADPYSVDAVAVDVTADSAAQARRTALARAQRRAFATVLRRLALPGRAPDAAQLEQSTIGALVQDLSISNEQTSAVRYIADIQVRFAGGRVRRFFHKRGIGYSETPAAPVVVLPVFTDAQGGRHLWDSGNAWRAAWQNAEIPTGLVPIRLPDPAKEASQAFSAAGADRADYSRYRRFADAHGAGAAIIAGAELVPRLSGGPDLDILVRRSGDRLPPNSQLLSLDRRDGETTEALLRRGVRRTARRIRTRWKRLTAVDPSARGELLVRLAPQTAKALVGWRRDLADIAMVAGIEPVALSYGEVRWRLTHLGPRPRLSRVLASHGIALEPTAEAAWALRRRGTDMRPGS